MDKKSPSQTVKDVIERKQVVSRYVYGVQQSKTINDGKGGRADNPSWVTGPQIKQVIDIPFEVGRIVCEHVTWFGGANSTEAGITLVRSNLFDGEVISPLGDIWQYYESGIPDTTTGVTQTTSGAEMVFKEPKKIRNQYWFGMTELDGSEEEGRDGELVVLLKFYEY
jgi:hypothetical protein